MDFHFFSKGFLPSPVNLVIFLYWGGPVPYLELFWVGPVKENTLYLPPLQNTLKEQSQRLVTFETFDQSDEDDEKCYLVIKVEIQGGFFYWSHPEKF